MILENLAAVLKILWYIFLIYILLIAIVSITYCVVKNAVDEICKDKPKDKNE